MTCKPVAALLVDLGVTRSHSRPRVSNDNPYSEAWFKTLKYCPVFPGPVRLPRRPPGRSVPSSSTTTTTITGTPGSGFTPRPTSTTAWPARSAAQRSQTLDAARQRHPTRFATTPTPRSSTYRTAAWINQPKIEEPAA